MRLVVALGGNALGNTPIQQKELVKATAISIVDMIEQGHSVVVTHGNGPQVGMINLAFSLANAADNASPQMPFPECGAMSQGYIGYHLQSALDKEMRKRGINKRALSIVTQVVVEENDSAFFNPTKPIGAFYPKVQAEALAAQKGYVMKEIENKGYRRVVASPKPVDIVEKDAVANLVEQGFVVITVGGGGIPVVEKEGEYLGVDAVIDKDYASALVATLIDADRFVILTAVDKVYINYGKPNEQALDILNVSQAEQYIKQGQFGKGSMLPKVEAALSFVKRSKKPAVIASLENSAKALNGQSGTEIII